MMILAAVSSGRSLFCSSARSKLARPAGAGTPQGLNRRRCRRGHRCKGRGADGDDLFWVDALHGLDGIAGINRPLEGVGRHHLDDVGNLHDIEQRRHARHDVLARGGRGRHHRVVVRHQPDDQGSDFLGELMGELRGIGIEHLGRAIELGGGLGHRLAVGTGHQHVDVLAQRPGGGHGLGDGRRQRLVVVLRQQKSGHDNAPASFSLATSSAALATLTPALRPGGSTVFTTLRRGAISTP